MIVHSEICRVLTLRGDEMSIKQRLHKLESKDREQVATPMAIVVIYDPVTGQPRTPVDERATVRVWLPDNGRGDSRLMKEPA